MHGYLANRSRSFHGTGHTCHGPHLGTYFYGHPQNLSRKNVKVSYCNEQCSQFVTFVLQLTLIGGTVSKCVHEIRNLKKKMTL